MTNNILNTLEIKEFESEVHHIFQEQGNTLRGTTRFRNISGKEDQFPVLGRLQASVRSIGTPLVTSNQTATAVVISVTPYSVSQYTDIFLQSEINFDARQEAAASISMGLGRKLDQVIIDGLVATTSTKTVANNISGSIDDLTDDAVREAAKKLDVDGVTGERSAVVHPNGLHHLIGDGATTASVDYVNVKPNVNGRLDNYYGFKFYMIGNLGDETGLPIDGSNDRTNFFYSKDAIGTVMNIDMRVEINYDFQMGAHLVSGFMSAGSKEIDALGIVKVTTREA